jgi:uncharacterized protein (DUF302 family)
MTRLFTALLLAAPLSALAEGLWVHHTIEEEFDTIKGYIEEGITNQGLVVAHRSNVGDMLQRTGKDLVAKVQSATLSVMEMASSRMGVENPLTEPGTAPSAFARSEVVEFCSARLSRKMTDADPANVIFCPYSIAIYTTAEQPERVHVSYLQLSRIGSPSSRPVLEEVEAMLAAIVREATE